ncbi:unnamed protein product, partial [Prorocentrum cordatum]
AAADGGEDEGLGVTNLHRVFAKLVPQREDVPRTDARGDHVVASFWEDTQIAIALEASAQHYKREGQRAQEEGERPDAYLEVLLFRPNVAAALKSAEVDAAIQQGPSPADAKAAAQVFATWSLKAKDKDNRAVATRCFNVRMADEDEGKVATIKWAFATNSHPELRDALFLLRTTVGLRAAGSPLDFDSAPGSKAAKELEKMVFKKGGGQGEGTKKARKK